jgi:hypothetical protein
MNYDGKFKLLPRYSRWRPQGAVGQAQSAGLLCHCGSPALYMVAQAGQHHKFIGYCGKHKEEAEAAGRHNGRISQSHSEQRNDLNNITNSKRRIRDFSKHKR